MKNIRFILGLVLAIIGFLSTGFYTDDDRLINLIDKLELFTQENPQEKVHIHFDKPFYSIGDNIWLKAYVVNAEENKLSILSGVLHVDLVDERDSIKTFLFPLQDGLASGHINLADSLFAPGTYELRAYTKWMENYDSDYFFTKTITIGDALNGAIHANASFEFRPNEDGTMLVADLVYTDLQGEPQSLKPLTYQLNYRGTPLITGQAKTDEQGKFKLNYLLKKQIPPKEIDLNTTLIQHPTSHVNRNFRVQIYNQDVDLKFFPEGGYLVTGVRSKVAFKAIGNDGLSVAIIGHVEDQQKNKIVELETEHAGMGLFALTPAAGKSYTAVVTLKDGLEKRFALPVALTQGYVLSLNHLDHQNLLMRIDCKMTESASKEAFIVAQSNGIIVYSNKVDLSKGSVLNKLPKNMLQEGIVQFTLFSTDFTPLAERLVFIQPSKKLLGAKIEAKESYGKRERVNLNIKLADVSGKGQVGSYSIAVVNQDKVVTSEEDESTIASNLLLTSDLKGYIEKPNYYFTAVDQDKIKALDLLMLTQGWRRFKWEDVQRDKKIQLKYKAEKGLMISGMVTNLGKKPIPFAKVNLFVPSMFLLIDTVADENGRFVFEQLDFADSTKFIVRAKNAKDRNNVRIVLDTYRPVAFKRAVNIKNSDQTAFVKYLAYTEKMYNEQFKHGMVNKRIMLKQVEIKSKMPPVIARSDLPALVRADHTLTPDKLQSSGNLTDLMRTLPGVIIRGTEIYGTYGGTEGKMLILLNGMPIINVDGINPMSLAGVQVIKGGSAAESMGEPLPKNFYPQGGKVEGMAKFGIVFLTQETKATRYNTMSPSGMSHIKPLGYATVREFYSPAYDVAAKNEQMPDLRSTIYWNPNLITNQNGEANVSFFTADEPGRYLITLEGVALDGKLTRKTQQIIVK